MASIARTSARRASAVAYAGRSLSGSRALCTSQPRCEASSEHMKNSPEKAAVGHEAASVKSLIALGKQLATQAGSNNAPQRLRGIGYWSDRLMASEEGAPEAEDHSPLPPAPKTRKMADSFVSFDLLFEDDKKLLEVYTGAMTSIRTGRLMEDLDTLAGSVAYKHVLPDGYSTKDSHRANLYLVTAAVDRIDMLRPIDPRHPENLRLSGHVSYTGSSALEVLVRLDSISRWRGLENDPQAILVARFTMACRDTKTGKAKKIPALVPETPEERALFEMGREQKERKKEMVANSLELQPPNAEEAAKLHTLFVTKREDLFNPRKPRPEWMVPMAETELTTSILAHPQERNVHGKIFGGYLMRLAYELAFSSACMFAKNRVTFLALDELLFKQPVDVGSLIHMRSRVTFSPTELGEHHSFQVSTDVETIDVSTSERRTTNTFHWTFCSDHTLDRMVLPTTYREGLDWLGSMRRRAVGKELRRLYGIGK